MANHPIAVAILAFFLCLFEACHLSADSWTDDEVAIARLCVSEASFRPADDCRPIAWIVSHGARRRGVSIPEYVAQVHHRHTRSESRPWLAGLDAGMSEPAGWPESVSWPGRGAPAWSARLAEVRRALADDRHGCDRAPMTWGGRVDLDRIHRMEAAGWVRLRCGATANIFLARGDR